MYTVQRETAKNPHMNRPASSVRKYAPAQAAVPSYCQEPSESARSQSLGYTLASAGALAHMPIQRVPDDDKSNFFDNLSGIIQRHINEAAPNPQIAPSNKDRLWDSIKTDFNTDKNKEMLISKILSSNTPGVENHEDMTSVYNYFNYRSYTDKYEGKEIRGTVNTVFENLGTPISETLNDIFYWTTSDAANAVTAIQLTDSDLHHRGVGVCIVDYQNNSGQKKIVVKPEDKTFDKTVYGKKNEDTDDFQSLADDFNASLQNGSLGESFKTSRIGTLGIQTSDNNAFGSAMEFFEHKRFDKNDHAMPDNIDLHSVESLIAFSSLLGLADLHAENAVYSQVPKHSMQLIDAEIGMKYILDRTKSFPLLMTAMHKGEMILAHAPSVDEKSIHPEDFKNYDKENTFAFLDTAKQKLEGQKSRIVLLPTQSLFTYRTRYLEQCDEWYKNASITYEQELSGAVRQYYNGKLTPTFMKDGNTYRGYAETDFAAGRIPFFELDFSTGIIYQVFSGSNEPIAQYSAPDGTQFLDYMIQSRKDALTEEKKAQQIKKLLTTIGLPVLATLAVLAGGAGLYYLFHKS